MMRKNSFISLLFVICALLTVVFTSCDNGELPAETTLPETAVTDAPHVHSWSDWAETLKHTCTEDGVRERSCGCGEKESEIVPAPGHKEGSWIIDVMNTCTEKGSRHMECYACGYTMMTDEIGPMNHYNSQWVTEIKATCTVFGFEKNVCNLCSETISTRYVPKTQHLRGETVLELEPTCTSAGREAAYCLVCENEVYSKTFAAKGHVIGDWVTEKEATILLDGSRYKSCTVCGERTETEVLYSTGTPGLEYTLMPLGNSYQLTGLGTCTDSEIVIANGYNGLPVYMVGVPSGDNEERLRGITSVTLGDNMIYSGLSCFKYLQEIKVRDTNTKY